MVGSIPNQNGELKVFKNLISKSNEKSLWNSAFTASRQTMFAQHRPRRCQNTSFCGSFEKTQTSNRNVHSSLSATCSTGNKLYKASASQKQILVLPSPFYIPEDVHSHIFPLSRKHYYKNYPNASQLLLSKLWDDLGKYFQSVISIP